MKCCANCFQDRFLKNEIDRLSSQVDSCDFCNSNSVPVIDTTMLTDMFDLVCGIYVLNDEGERLVDLLISDWKLFSVGTATAQNLLVEILDDGEKARQRYSPETGNQSQNLASWKNLREELRCQNRFFPATDFNENRLEVLLAGLQVPLDDLPTGWYRARIESDGQAICSENMGAPPAKKATAGRANPVGIPYLYLASSKETAVAEVRPHPGESLTLAAFQIERGLNLIDLRNPRILITPFTMQETREVAELRDDMDFLVSLGKELSTPVLPDAAVVDYIPSQFLCEFIKKSGYDGVVYESSIEGGVNLALFDPAMGRVGGVSRVVIEQISVTSSTIVDTQ